MDNQRTILFFVLSFVLLLIWQAWQEDYVVPKATPVSAPIVSSLPDQGTTAAPLEVQQGQTPSQDRPEISSAPAVKPSVAPMSQVLNSDQRIRVLTDLYDIEIDTVGGDLRKVDLLTYPIDPNRPDIPFKLMEDKAFRLFIAQSGLLSGNSAPDHHAIYQPEQLDYTLSGSSDVLKIPLRWESGDGITVIKTYTFERDSFLIKVDHEIINNSDKPWKGHQYRQLQRTAAADSESSFFIHTYTGGVIFSEEESYEKIHFSDMEDENLARDIGNGWAAIIQHYFIGAWIPNEGETNHYYSKALDDGRYTLGLVSPEAQVEPGASNTFSTGLYVGSKSQDRLEPVANGLVLTVDYGILTLIAEPLFWLLKFFHELFGNWGWAIIGVTLVIKLVFYKLSEKSYRSMANMRKVTPKITAIRERYIDDRQRMSQAMMELYKKEKINPMGGCLPMLVQIPVFIALYWVLLESVELRQADFIFWLNDLSTKDPFYVLPLLMGLTMYIQQQLNPKPPDPMQAKIMAALPFIFTLFFAFFQSGLVLYWVVNAILSILQQWYITRRVDMGLEEEEERKAKIERDKEKLKGKNKKGKAKAKKEEPGDKADDEPPTKAIEAKE